MGRLLEDTTKESFILALGKKKMRALRVGFPPSTKMGFA